MSNYITERNRISFSLANTLSNEEFDDLALKIFQFQFRYNKIYRQFCELIHRKPENVKQLNDIPFLPIQFFKSNEIKTGKWSEETIFTSSGTTGQVRSQHFIKDLHFYLQNCVKGFSEYFSSPKDYCFIAILPGYEERPSSSLIFMINEFIKLSKFEGSGFYLGREKAMLEVLENNKDKGIPTVLFGVSFALLDLCNYELDFEDLIVIETGGMKNSAIELSKEEILERFTSAWNIKYVASEYGMTELLSQSYALDSPWYHSANTKRILIGTLSDPFALEASHKTGIIKVVDLANFDSCSFIETEDLGLVNDDGAFQVLGRMDNTELRGCNLLLDQSLKYPIS